MTEFKYYYIGETNDRQGPFCLEKFYSLVEDGSIKNHTKVWWTGMIDFVPYDEVAEEVESEIRAQKEEAAKQAEEEERNLIDQGLKLCPYCAELIQLRAIKCKHCGEWLEERQGAITKPPPILNEAENITSEKKFAGSPHPWLRYTARVFDYSVVAPWVVAAPYAGLFFIWPNEKELLVNAPVATIICLLIWGLFEATFLALFRTTPGKALVGIRVEMPGGSKIPFGDGLWRYFNLLMKGLAFGIPILSFVTMVVAYNRLVSRGRTSWDESLNIVVRHKNVGTIRVIFAWFLIICFIFVLAGIADGSI